MATENATATEKTLGILLPCPCCGDAEASISLDLGNADMKCASCDGEFNVETIKLIMEKWTPVVAWIRAMPSDKE